MKTLALVLLAGIISTPVYAEEQAPAADQAGQDHRGHMMAHAAAAPPACAEAKPACAQTAERAFAVNRI